jgi:hypothetical protein
LVTHKKKCTQHEIQDSGVGFGEGFKEAREKGVSKDTKNVVTQPRGKH